LKPYWTDELTELKEASIDAHRVWINCGKPKAGFINTLRIHCKYKYKLAVRKADEEFKHRIDDEISELYLRKDFDKFWHKWKNKFGKCQQSTTHINGFTKDKDIANEFSSHLSGVCYNSYDYAEEFEKCKSDMQNLFLQQDACKNDNLFSVSDIEQAIDSLKVGEASGLDGLSKEHITFSHPAIVIHLKILYNIISCISMVLCQMSLVKVSVYL